ncbi:hypothetical protein PIB30_071286 [Stylosanthes scabra]|uniref:Uncharacterized protein n=1 Tax=Stylosanthes scabra TaxID=79078 RepID=A0ABU6XNE1_9FABA|nr:hypothetical protein [Stylosanthes scabra]
MTTRSKTGSLKPQTLVASVDRTMDYSKTVPKSVQQSKLVPQWAQAMETELQALAKSKTWSLVDPPPNATAIHLHINPFSAIALGHAVGLVIEGTSSYLEHRDLAPHSKSFRQSLRDPTLTLAPSVGSSYSRNKKHRCR